MKKTLQICKGLGPLIGFFAAAVVVIVMASGQHQRAFASATNTPVVSYFNPLQVALLCWYPANLTANFPVGHGPSGLAFDGSSIWVVNVNDYTVTKLRTSDGTVLGTFTVANTVGNNAVQLAFDGANIWVANDSNNTVTKYSYSEIR